MADHQIVGYVLDEEAERFGQYASALRRVDEMKHRAEYPLFSSASRTQTRANLEERA